MVSISNCFNETRAAVAAMYARQILNMPMEMMGDHEKTTILDRLGIDVDALSHEGYRQELLQDRIKKFRDFNIRLFNEIDTMMQDARLERETAEAAV